MVRPKGTRKVAPGKRASEKLAESAKRRPQRLQPVDRRPSDEPDAKSERARLRAEARKRELIPGVNQQVWLAVWLASMISIVGLFLLAYSFAEDVSSSAEIGARLAAVATVPLALLVLAFVSRAPQRWRATGTAVAAFIVVVAMGVVMFFITGSDLLLLAFGVPMALAVGGAFALRRKYEEVLRTRLYVAMGFSVLGLFLAAVPALAAVTFMLPFPSLILADYLFERRRKKKGGGAATGRTSQTQDA